MLSRLRRRRETAERIDAEADALIGELGVEAYAEARRREYESSGDAISLWWNRVALAVAHKIGRRIGLDTSTPMTMNAVFAPDREYSGNRQPQPFRQADEPKGTLALQPFRVQFIGSAPDRGQSIVTELEIQASDASGAIVAAAKIAMPPRTITEQSLETLLAFTERQSPDVLAVEFEEVEGEERPSPPRSEAVRISSNDVTPSGRTPQSSPSI
jgi:hypothetical protein